MAFTKFHLIFSKGRNFTRGDHLEKKNMCLLFFHEESIHEVSRRYLILQNFSVQNLEKGQKLKIFHMIFFQFFIKNSIHHPLSADTSFKFLACILF